MKKLRLSKALTIPEGTTVSDACRTMAARRVDAVLLTDANALLSGIVTDKVLCKMIDFLSVVNLICVLCFCVKLFCLSYEVLVNLYIFFV